MDDITIPFHLALPGIFCLILLIYNLFYRKQLLEKNRILWISIVIFLVTYLLIVGSATFSDIYYQWNLNRYDLDKDGLFSGEEITEEMREALDKLTNDTGRNFSFITGFIFSLLISIMVYILGRLLYKNKTADKNLR